MRVRLVGLRKIELRHSRRFDQVNSGDLKVPRSHVNPVLVPTDTWQIRYFYYVNWLDTNEILLTSDDVLAAIHVLSQQYVSSLECAPRIHWNL